MMNLNQNIGIYNTSVENMPCHGPGKPIVNIKEDILLHFRGLGFTKAGKLQNKVFFFSILFLWVNVFMITIVQ